MESSYVRFCNFGPDWDQIAGFSLLRQGIGKSSALAKNFLPLSHYQEKLPLLVGSPYKCLSPSTKYQFPCFKPINFIFSIFSFAIAVAP